MIHGVPKGHEQPVGIERLLEEIKRAPLGCLDRRRDGPMTRDHDDGRAGIDGLEPGQHRESIETGHLHIEDHHMRTEFLEQRQALAA